MFFELKTVEFDSYRNLQKLAVVVLLLVVNRYITFIVARALLELGYLLLT